MKRWIVVSVIILASLVPLLAGLFDRSADSSTTAIWNGFTLPLKSGEGLVFACCDPIECIAKGDCCDCPTTTTTDDEDGCYWYCNDCGCQLCSPPECDEEDPCANVNCDDGNPCTKDECNNGVCQYIPFVDPTIGCNEGCGGIVVQCDSGFEAYCIDRTVGGPVSVCEDASGLSEDYNYCETRPDHPGCQQRQEGCRGAVDNEGDCYPPGACVMDDFARSTTLPTL